MLLGSVGQGFGQGTAGVACLCSMISGAPAIFWTRWGSSGISLFLQAASSQDLSSISFMVIRLLTQQPRAPKKHGEEKEGKGGEEKVAERRGKRSYLSPSVTYPPKSCSLMSSTFSWSRQL